MKISVTQKEITAGLVAFLSTQGFSNLDPATIKVEYTQGRGKTGLTAVLDTDPQPEEAAELKDDNGVTRAKTGAGETKKAEPSTDKLPEALGGTAASTDPKPETTAQAVAQGAQVVDGAAESETAKANAQVDQATETKTEAGNEGGSLFS